MQSENLANNKNPRQLFQQSCWWKTRKLLTKLTRADLDHVDLERLVERREGSSSSKKVAHEASSSRSELHNLHLVGHAHLLPGSNAPNAHKLTEHLADLGRRGEVSLPAEHVALHVVAVVWVAQRPRHELGDGQRALHLDHGPQQVHQRRLQALDGFSMGCRACSWPFERRAVDLELQRLRFSRVSPLLGLLGRPKPRVAVLSVLWAACGAEGAQREPWKPPGAPRSHRHTLHSHHHIAALVVDASTAVHYRFDSVRQWTTSTVMFIAFERIKIILERGWFSGASDSEIMTQTYV